MYSAEQLKFAQKFPFSQTAAKIIKENDFSLKEIPLEVVDRAKAMVLNASRKKDYLLEDLTSEMQLNEVLAFPVAKIFVSVLNKDYLNENFARMISDNCFHFLESDKTETAFELAKQLGIAFRQTENNLFELDLIVFLQPKFEQEFMKLVNQSVENGKVFLDKNNFYRFVSEMVFQKIFSALPADLSAVPKELKQLARDLGNQLIFSPASFARRNDFAPIGKIEPNLFPPCISEIYFDLLNHKKISHNARFNLATFLLSVGMPVSQIVDLFKNTPNFDKRVTEYQIKRIKGSGTKQAISPSGCAKMVQVQLCRKNELCGFKPKHPVNVYRNLLKSNKKEAKKA